MQVSHVNDHATHAIIGGKQTIEMGISDSAEFFNILSSTLYKDQILAVVREVLCNANDAHIEAGVTKPFEVILDNEKFVVKDFGKGIHLDDMGVIYGTYGNSTKKNDGKQTGGFGLGCKAPFAYTDHFEVISCHDGVKTIYSISKSSAQAVGKPAITPIASIPTTETGLQVTIKLKSVNDKYRFNKLVERIIHNGDMNAKFNEQPVKTLGFDISKSNYLVIRDIIVLDTMPRIMIRYGNVIYPIDVNEAIKQEYRQIERYLDKLEGRYDNYYLILQAPPHSITVTPSRESISMQDFTVATLKKLFSDFWEEIETKFYPICDQYAKQAVDIAVKDKNIISLLNTDKKLPESINNPAVVVDKATQLNELAYLYMSNNYPQDFDFQKKDIKYRLESMVKEGMLNRGLVQTYLRSLESTVENKSTRSIYAGKEHTKWLQKQIVAPLISKLIKAKIDPHRLYLLDSNSNNIISGYYNARGQGAEPLVKATAASHSHILDSINYFRNIVVVGTALKNIRERSKHHPVKQKYGDIMGCMFYHVSLKQKEKQAALDFFNASGMEVIDLTVRQDWEPIPEPRNTVKAKAKVGLPCLAGMLVNGRVERRYLLSDDVQRIENPEFIIDMAFNKDTPDHALSNDYWGLWKDADSRIIIELFGDKGAVSKNSITYKNWLDKGVKPINQYVEEKVIEYIKNSPTIKEYWAFRLERISYCDNDMFITIYNNEVLRKHFGIINNLTYLDNKYLELFNTLRNSRAVSSNEIKAVEKYLEDIPLSPINQTIMDKFTGNPYITLLNPRSINNMIKGGDITKQKVAIDLLIQVLNY